MPKCGDARGTSFSLRGKFNTLLEERLMDGDVEFHHIMSIDVQPEKFTATGELSESGKTGFWSKVSKAMHKLFTGDITLRPRQYLYSQAAKQPETPKTVSESKYIDPLKGVIQRKLPMPPGNARSPDKIRQKKRYHSCNRDRTRSRSRSRASHRHKRHRSSSSHRNCRKRHDNRGRNNRSRSRSSRRDHYSHSHGSHKHDKYH